MKRLIPVALIGFTLVYSTLAIAAEEWVEVTVNQVGDRFSIDKNSIQRSDGKVWYWEYRAFPQPNNAFVDLQIEEPVHGVLLYQAADCAAGTEQMRRLVVFGKQRNVIQRVNYDDNGRVSKPMAGSSAETVLRFACSQ